MPASEWSLCPASQAKKDARSERMAPGAIEGPAASCKRGRGHLRARDQRPAAWRAIDRDAAAGRRGQDHAVEMRKRRSTVRLDEKRAAVASALRLLAGAKVRTTVRTRARPRTTPRRREPQCREVKRVPPTGTAAPDRKGGAPRGLPSGSQPPPFGRRRLSIWGQRQPRRELLAWPT